jgi:transcriptional regulator with XRE-family HTH domain
MPKIALRQNQQLAIGRALSILRKTKGYKRDYLAGKIGLSCASIDKLEQGITSAKFADVVIICRTLEVEMGEFVCLYEKELNKLPPPPIDPEKGCRI